MMRIVAREILIFVLSVAVIPAALIAVRLHEGSLGPDLSLLIAGMVIGGASPGVAWLSILFIILGPYLIVQGFRGLRWAGQSVQGRRWANLYFSAVFFSGAAWALLHAWDLYAFMCAMGDIPAELIQFVEIEGLNVLIFVVGTSLGTLCFRVFLDPNRNGDRPSGHAS